MSDDEPLDPVLYMALAMYENEPCRICGENIEKAELRGLVFAGYSRDNKSRAAHGACWTKGLPQIEWAYPENEVEPITHVQ